MALTERLYNEKPEKRTVFVTIGRKKEGDLNSEIKKVECPNCRGTEKKATKQEIAGGKKRVVF
jgi:hypothetical protein